MSVDRGSELDRGSNVGCRAEPICEPGLDCRVESACEAARLEAGCSPLEDCGSPLRRKIDADCGPNSAVRKSLTSSIPPRSALSVSDIACSWDGPRPMGVEKQICCALAGVILDNDL